MDNDHGITGELRRYASYAATDRFRQSMLDIADRIDAAHEQAMAAAALIAGVPMTDEHMAEHGWYRALDADKVPIRIGDKADSDHYEDGTVTGVQFYETANGGIRTLVAVRPDGWDVATWHVPDEYHHHKPPTVEDVLREFGRAWVEWEDGSPYDPIAKFAAKLRLAGDE